MKNGKKLGKRIAKGVVKFGEGMKEAYAEEYGAKPKKRNAITKTKTKTKTKLKKKTVKGVLKITLARPEATVDKKWHVQWSKKGSVSISGKGFSTEEPARKYLAKLKEDKKALGHTIEYTYIRT